MHRSSASDASTSVRGISRNCPVCDNSAAVTVFENCIAPTAGYDFSSPIKCCAACDSAYAGYALAPSNLDRYYSSLSKYDTVATRADISALDRERAKLATTFLTPILDSLTSVLDVGCASGVLLHELREAGVKHVSGIDPAEDAPAVARALFDILVTQAQAESYDQYGNHDLVCLMAVLEHLRDPGRLLRDVARHLRPDGRVLIEVPDAGAFDRPGDDRLIEPYGEFSNEHINFFCIADIQRLGRSAGLEVERWKTLRIAYGAPDLFVLLRRSAAALELPAPDIGSSASRLNGGESVRKYIALSKLGMHDVERRLGATDHRKVLIYGAGNHTGRLLAQSPTLADAEVLAVLDRNPHLEGATIGGHRIFSPAALGKFPRVPVIISTFNARHEIHAALKAVTSQPLVLLYD